MRNKLSVTALVVLLALSLLPTGQIASAQSTTTKQQHQPIELLLATTAAMLPVIQNNCRTKECADLAGQAITLVTNAQQDDANGILVGDRAKTFLQSLHDVYGQLITSMKNSLTPAEQQQLKSCKGCNQSGQNSEDNYGVRPAVLTKDSGARLVLAQYNSCQLCQQVYQDAVEICAAYGIVCPPCVAICISVATSEYIACLEQNDCTA